MNIGYACLNIGPVDSQFKSLRLNNLNEENFLKVTENNLESLDNILDYNIENQIKSYRISSDLIPFASYEHNIFNWQDVFVDKLNKLGDKAKKAGLRLSMHPGQYTVINSDKPEVVEKSFQDLRYHCDLMNLLGLDSSHKIILHIGGVYGDKEKAIKRFEESYKKLDQDIRDRLIIENDDKSYNFDDLLSIALRNNIPLVYDTLHHQVNKSNSKSHRENILLASKTWKDKDGQQKIHYSQQDKNKKPGSHSPTIGLESFYYFYKSVEDLDLNIMLEVKDKNLSTIKVKNLLYKNNIKDLEQEWALYKYSVLEKSPRIYDEIRQLLKDKSGYPIFDFYKLIDQALGLPLEKNRAINGLDHVWGYFKKSASEKEKLKYKKYLANYKKGTYTIKALKKFLYQLALKYNSSYLLNSYYFSI